MTVRVDQPRQHGRAAEIAGIRGQRPLRLVDRGHPPVIDGKGTSVDRTADVEVEEPDIPEHLAHAVELPPTKPGIAPTGRILGHPGPAREPSPLHGLYLSRVLLGRAASPYDIRMSRQSSDL